MPKIKVKILGQWFTCKEVDWSYELVYVGDSMDAFDLHRREFMNPEDTEITIDNLRYLGLPESVLEAVDAITHRSMSL